MKKLKRNDLKKINGGINPLSEIDCSVDMSCPTGLCCSTGYICRDWRRYPCI
ncbi:hypothetical protein [Chryseobacterium shigense]|uniref:hypothetical protein n=1 Tax=Chryseobacterium shigense TaxID=297244 RepID=UPI0013FD4760|nr:hypothetical protein [Chryseobacterium shigense]